MGIDTYYHVTDGSKEYYVVEMYDVDTDSYSYEIEEHTEDAIIDIIDQKLRAKIIGAIKAKKDR